MVLERPTESVMLVTMIVLAMPFWHAGWEPPAGESGDASMQFASALTPATVFGPLQPGAEQAPAEATGPLPFDPLSSTEKRDAVTLAMEHDAIASASRIQVIGVALYTDKSFKDLADWPRMAEVWVYDYATDTTLRALVDLGDRMVRSVDALAIQPPLVADEVRRAGQLALDDAGVLERLADRGIPAEDVGWNARLWHDPEGAPACTQHRCVLVAVLDGARFVSEPLVLVDLSAERVAGILNADYQLIEERSGEATA